MTSPEIQSLIDEANRQLEMHATTASAIERLHRRNGMDHVATEKATHEWDLPHPYEATSAQDAECVCHRPQLDPIHSPDVRVTEHASASQRLTTEKGS